MKSIFTLTVLIVLSLSTTSAFCTSGSNKPSIDGGKKKEITIGSNRASGDMLLRFNATKAGEVSIIIFNEDGKVVSQQTNQVNKRNNVIVLKNATSLPEGAYTVELTANGETHITGFMMLK